MNLTLDPGEYEKLIELTYLGEWLINSHHDPELQDEKATSVVQKVFGAKKLPGIDQDIETKDYFLKDTWVEKLYGTYIEDYDDHVFWEELTERLAQRDLAKERGMSPETIERDDDLMELKPLEEKYHAELEEYGVDRLIVDTDI